MAVSRLPANALMQTEIGPSNRRRDWPRRYTPYAEMRSVEDEFWYVKEDPTFDIYLHICPL
jgi:hypothetical protein